MKNEKIQINLNDLKMLYICCKSESEFLDDSKSNEFKDILSKTRNELVPYLRGYLDCAESLATDDLNHLFGLEFSTIQRNVLAGLVQEKSNYADDYNFSKLIKLLK